MMLAWGAKVSEAFRARVVEIAGELGCDPSWLMACMAFETGRTFSPAVKNPSSGATGLIQFMPSTARMLGTTTDALAEMTAEEQLDYVLAYFRPFAGKIKSLADCYMAILWPAAVGKPDDHVLFAEGSKAFLQNRGLDINHDGAVTKGECVIHVRRQLDSGFTAGNVFQTETQLATEKKGMDPLTILAMFGPTLAKLIPQIAEFLRKEPEKKVETVAKVLDTIVSAAGQPNMQGAVEAMQKDPAVREKVTQAVVTHPEIIGLIEVGGGIEKAREHGLAMQVAEKPFWFNPVFWISVAFFPMMYMIVGAVLFTKHGDLPELPYWASVGFDAQTRSGLVNLIVGFVFGGIVGVWFGTSWGSQRKTEIAASEKGAV